MKKRLTLPRLKQKLQIVFNQYIVERDKGKPCVACGQPKPLEAGHYYSVRMYDGLRFDETNVHGECHYCNCFDDSHLIHYRYKLKERIGQHDFELLEKKAEDYKKNGYRWERSQLEAMISYYTRKLKELRQ